MKKYLTTLLIGLVLLVGNTVVCTAGAEKLTMETAFEQRNGEMFLRVSGVTPASYEQRLFVLVYDPKLTNGLNEILDENGRVPEDIAGVRPISGFTSDSVLRMTLAEASINGEYDVSIPISDDIANGQYMIVQVSGGGSFPVGCSRLVYYETNDHLQSVTLPRFEGATASDLDGLFRDKQFLLGMTLDEDYELNRAQIANLFIQVRDTDYFVDPSTDCKFNSIDDVLSVLKVVKALRTISSAPTELLVANFINGNKALIDYDFTNNDYILTIPNCHQIVAKIFSEKAPCSMTEVARVIEQAVGLAIFNRKDSTTIGQAIDKYGAKLGISPEDYAAYCRQYGDYEVNKAFINKNFTKPSEVLVSLKDRIEHLSHYKSEASSSGSSSGGGSSSKKTYIGSVSVGEKSKDDKTTENGMVYKDVDASHWGNEAIKVLSEKNIINGFVDGNFLPDENVSREQFVKMIVSAFKMEGISEIKFKDVDIKRWSEPYISVATACGIVKGVRDNYFMPTAMVTRQDAAVMLVRLCSAENIELSGNAVPSDGDEIAEYAYDSVTRLLGAKVLNGFEDGSFRPNEKLTRAQAAKLIYELINR